MGIEVGLEADFEDSDGHHYEAYTCAGDGAAKEIGGGGELNHGRGMACLIGVGGEVSLMVGGEEIADGGEGGEVEGGTDRGAEDGGDGAPPEGGDGRGATDDG